MDKEYYFTKIYPLQDKILKTINALETGFYLTGGTAASRGYLHHRFSEDLDFFVNDDDRFGLWAEKIIYTLSKGKDWKVDALQRDDRYIRLSLVQEDALLKIELINDVPSHIGNVINHEILGRLDSPENILANKITAIIDRQEPKDFADIWGFCCKMGISIINAITDAKSKAAGIFPPDLARVLCSASQSDWEVIQWIEPPDREEFVSDLYKLGESLIIE